MLLLLLDIGEAVRETLMMSTNTNWDASNCPLRGLSASLKHTAHIVKLTTLYEHLYIIVKNEVLRLLIGEMSMGGISALLILKL